MTICISYLRIARMAHSLMSYLKEVVFFALILHRQNFWKSWKVFNSSDSICSWVLTRKTYHA